MVLVLVIKEQIKFMVRLFGKEDGQNAKNHMALNMMNFYVPEEVYDDFAKMY